MAGKKNGIDYLSSKEEEDEVRRICSVVWKRKMLTE